MTKDWYFTIGFFFFFLPLFPTNGRWVPIFLLSLQDKSPLVMNKVNYKYNE